MGCSENILVLLVFDKKNRLFVRIDSDGNAEPSYILSLKEKDRPFELLETLTDFLNKKQLTGRRK